MVILVYIALCLIWSTTWLAIKYAIADVQPLTAAAARFWIAALFFLLLHCVRPIRFPKDWPTRFAIMAWGCAQIGISYALVYWSERYIASGMTAVLFATFPFFVAVTSARIIKDEHWTTAKVIGLACGLLGVAVVFVDEIRVGSTLGAVAVCAVVVASAVGGISVTYIKRDFHNIDTVALTTLQMVGGAVSLSLAAVAFETPQLADWTTSALVATLYLALVGSAAAFLGYYWLLMRIDSTTLASFAFITPVLALIWGWLFLSESVTRSVAVGGALVLAGVWSVARSGRRASPQTAAQTS